MNQRRADYFCRYLLGKTQEAVDIVELNREQQQTGGALTPRDSNSVNSQSPNSQLRVDRLGVAR